VYFSNTHYTKSIFNQDDGNYRLEPNSKGGAYMWNKKTGNAWYISSPDKPGFTSSLDKENLRKYPVR
jgi:L-alanine-DL-glutamate epimerase-like enolase superfamily enzyme